MLLKRGVKKKSANKMVDSTRCTWSLAHTAALDKAFLID